MKLYMMILEVGKMSDLALYLLEITKILMENSEDHEFSPEVWDRAVSVIGLVVPLGLYLLVLFCIALAALSLYQLLGGRRK